jgi:predicted phage-related endonuclease
MLATVDGLAVDNFEESDYVIEVKKVDDWSWDEIPTHYNLQVQWQMAVLEVPQAYLAVLHRGRRLEMYPVTADPELQAELIEAGEHFWTTYVVPEVPPPATAEDNTFLGDLYFDTTETAVEVDAEIVSELRAAKRSMKKAKARLAAAEAALKELMQGSETAVVGQEVVATWKEQERAGYVVKPTKFRRLVVKGNNDE